MSGNSLWEQYCHKKSKLQFYRKRYIQAITKAAAEVTAATAASTKMNTDKNNNNIDVDAVLTIDQQRHIANVSALILLVYGLVMVLSPHKESQLFYYGTTHDDDDPNKVVTKNVIDYNVQHANLCLIECGLVWLLMEHYNILPFERACCLCSIPWLIFALHSVLNDIPTTKLHGRTSYRASYTILVLNAARFMTFITDSTEGMKLITQFNIIFSLLIGFMSCSIPTIIQTLYAFPKDEDERIVMVRRVYGNNMFAFGVFGTSIIWFNTTHLMAYGLAWSSVLMGMLWLMTDLKRLGANMKPIYVWMSVMLLFAYTLTYQPTTTTATD
jgi:hypothetical protein